MRNQPNYSAEGRLVQIKAPEKRPGYSPSMYVLLMILF